MRKREWNEVEIVSGLRAISVLFVLFALVSPVFVLSSLASDEEDVAISAILGAEDSMGLAYEAVLEAEEAGANVSRLLTRLNVAGEYLAKAHTSLKKGDFASVVEDANHGKEIAEEVEADAGELKRLAPRERRQQLLFSMMGSMIAIGAVGFGSVIGWHVFKGRYRRRISETKPKVNEHGA